jgi:hypothetical protein
MELGAVEGQFDFTVSSVSRSVMGAAIKLP